MKESEAWLQIAEDVSKAVGHIFVCHLVEYSREEFGSDLTNDMLVRVDEHLEVAASNFDRIGTPATYWQAVTPLHEDFPANPEYNDAKVLACILLSLEAEDEGK